MTRASDARIAAPESTASDTTSGGSSEKPASGTAGSRGSGAPDASEPDRIPAGRIGSSTARRAARANPSTKRAAEPKTPDVGLGVRLPVPASGQTTPATPRENCRNPGRSQAP